MGNVVKYLTYIMLGIRVHFSVLVSNLKQSLLRQERTAPPTNAN